MEKQPLVLIVDDEPDFRDIFRAKLGAEGMQVETAENGQVGVSRAKELRPDLILMDVKMPVMDGAAAVLKLRDDPEMKDVKVAFLTSLGDPRGEIDGMNHRLAIEFGVQAYLRKTDDLDELSEKIKALLKA